MGINHWEWEGMGLKKIFPLISTSEVVSQCHSEVECIFPDDGQMCDCGGSMHVDNVASMIDRARRNGYCAPDLPSFDVLCDDADDVLFSK